MLTIGKLAAGPTTGRYYIDQVARGREDYYAGEGEVPRGVAWRRRGDARPGRRGRRGGDRPAAECRGPGDVLPALRDELLSHRQSNENAGPDALVFPTASGSRRDKDNARERVIRPVVAHADTLLAARGHRPLPEGVTAHKLRHTFASILFVRGEDPPYVMAQLGHTDPAFTLRVYAHAMRREEGDKERLKALVEGRDWALLGTTRADEGFGAPATQPARDDEVPADAGTSDDGRGGFRTCDLSRVKHGVRAASGHRNACKSEQTVTPRNARGWASYGPIRPGLAQRMAQRRDPRARLRARTQRP